MNILLNYLYYRGLLLIWLFFSTSRFHNFAIIRLGLNDKKFRKKNVFLKDFFFQKIFFQKIFFQKFFFNFF